MSANQILRPNGGLTHGMARNPHDHDCPDCWRHGGPGHDLVPEDDALPGWAQPSSPARQPMASGRARCSYWSARGQAHCGDTEKIRHHPGIGPRCEAHDPDLLAELYRGLVKSTEMRPA
ncbi:hypothetical protein [Nonomuraea wenchangensis]|uniref:hypothetical protein n=1 Tax=Nonomuraea wenchangensis TaxID=568860 RepID=UPI003326A8BA